MVPADSRRIPRVLRYSGAASLRLDGFGYGAVTRYGAVFQQLRLHFTRTTAWSYNPDMAGTMAVWAAPRSLATTWGIIVIFFSCGY